MSSSFAIECDVLVIGSGAGGLAAAVTARWHGLDVLVVEKEAVFGGATAWSGGWIDEDLSNPAAQELRRATEGPDRGGRDRRLAAQGRAGASDHLAIDDLPAGGVFPASLERLNLDQETNAMVRPLSLAALTVLELSPPEMASCAAQAGYSHVGLRLIPATPEEPQYPIIGDTPMVRETLKRLDDTGVRVLDVEIFRLKPDTCIADYEPAMETGAWLGASDLLVAGNDPDEARLIVHLGEFCDMAARLGLNASLEFMPWTDVRDLSQAARIVGAAARANSGVLIDAFHLDRSGSRIEDIAQIPREWLHFMQLCDVPAERPANMEGIIAEARAERLFPGEGGLNLLGLLRALPHDIPISIEIPTAKLAQTISAVDRARRALAATKALLLTLD